MKTDIKSCRVKRLSTLPDFPHTLMYRRYKLGDYRLLTLCYVDIAEKLYHPDVTIVGTAICAPKDNPSHAIGRAIARGRASHLYTLWTEPDERGTSPQLKTVAYGQVRHPSLVELLHALGTPPYMAKAFMLSYGQRVAAPENRQLIDPGLLDAVDGNMIGRVENVRWVEISPHDKK